MGRFFLCPSATMNWILAVSPRWKRGIIFRQEVGIQISCLHYPAEPHSRSVRQGWRACLNCKEQIQALRPGCMERRH
jgi:hypothetical protein